uniref:NADH-ubiquinone oxidoreductase chain 4 n=1 Tax=Mesaphorura yosii TaxID=1840514 RepID=A0A6H0EXB9_9HEXA|nr:NADH dehydrogenase subunit 4 [Mesaphorura yosii]
MKMIFFLLFWGFGILLMNMEFWFSVVVLSLFYFLSLFISPLGLGMNMMGDELELDTLSYSLFVLSVWVLILMFMCSSKIYSEKVMDKYFVFLLMLMLLTLALTFSMSNYLGLYIFFEASLIPTLLVIVGWGYQIERLQAGVYFLFYTIFSSLPLLVLIILSYSNSGSMNLLYSLMLVFPEVKVLEVLVFLGLTSAFLVKMPLFFVHLWLPSAHVEAPVAGSMILAGVLLKLGGYGLCRVMFEFPSVMLYFSNILVSLGIVSMVMVGLICCRLNDMKALVAYSSVAHMGLVVAGLYVGGFLGFTGALIMMLGHGLASSGLFSILNMYYERTGSRSFYLNSGMIVVLPIFSLFMFLLCACNMGAPPSINLLSELYLLGGLMSFSKMMLIFLPLGSFLGVVFTIYLFSYSQHGKMNGGVQSYWVVSFVELNSLVLHSLPLNVLFLKLDPFMLWL